MSAALQLNITDLCRAIEREHKATRSHYNKACDHAIGCGQYLIEAKSKALSGDWLGFVSRNFTFSHRTAQLYMRAARYPQRVAHLSSLRSAQKLLAKPKLDPPEPVAPTVVDAPSMLTEPVNEVTTPTPTEHEDSGRIVEELLPETAPQSAPMEPLSKPRKPTKAQLERQEREAERAKERNEVCDILRKLPRDDLERLSELERCWMTSAFECSAEWLFVLAELGRGGAAPPPASGNDAAPMADDNLDEELNDEIPW